MEIFRQVGERLRFADVIDILVVSVVVYLGFRLVSRARTRSVALVAGTLGLLYLLARFTEMRLTTALFQAGFLVLVLAMLVAFQDDIRRFFQRVAGWRFSRRSEVHATAIEVAVQTAQSLVKGRIGALMVFEGDEPLGAFLSGGQPLDGRLSPALIESLFHTKTPGHDGALVISHGRAASFGVHLPLADQTGTYGTRHRSALGLSERSDALVVVVSEERGQVRVAERGQLSAPLNADKLRKRLLKFEADRTREAPNEAGLFHLDNLFKLASVAVALGLWLGFGLQVETVQLNLRVPIEYRNVPTNMRIESGMRQTAVATVSGTESALDGITRKGIRISLDLSDLESGTQPVVLSQDAIELPPGVLANSVQPPVLNLQMVATEIRTLPITVVTKGKLPTGSRVIATPPNVRAQIKKGATDVAKTTPISVEDLIRDTTVVVKVLLPPSARSIEATATETQVSLSLPPAVINTPPADPG